jgi:hypothetical protein
MDPLRTGTRLLRSGLACAALALAPLAGASDAFTSGLSQQERASSGVASLDPAHLAALDGLVSRDVTLAHEGGVTGFSATFTERLTAAERAAAGIDALSAGERAALDALVARAIAIGPSPSEAFAYSPPRPAPIAPRELVKAPPALEVHGDLSFTVGGGSHGSSFYGTSADLFVTDPSGRFTLGVGVETYRGRGFFPFLDPLCDVPPYRDPWLAP